MAKRGLSILKSFFLTGLYPTQQQFHDMLDSFVHKDDGIGVNQVSGLTDILNGKYSKEDAKQLENRIKSLEDANTELQNQIDALSSSQQRAYTLDFGTSSELVQDTNLLGTITINRILAQNVAALYVSYGSVVRQQVSTTEDVELEVPDATVLVWEIVRATEDELACVGVGFEINNGINTEE